MTPAQFNRAMGAVIEKERLIRGITLKAIGDELGFSYQQAQKYCAGTNACSAFVISRFAQIFQTSVAYLYEQAGVQDIDAVPRPEHDDAIMAARYIAKISDARTRQILIDMTRKFAYRGEVA